MGIPFHDHCYIMVINQVLSPLWYEYQTLEVHICQNISNEENYLKVLDVTDEEPMETRVPNVTGKVKVGNN